MIILGILLSAAGVGVFCWALFNLAVFALPFVAGLSAGLAALQSGSGAVGAILIGFAVAVLTFVAGQSVFTLVRSASVRAVVALLFAAPAAFAGYYMTLHLSSLVATGETWRQVFAVTGAVAVCMTAIGRLMQPILPPDRMAITTVPAEQQAGKRATPAHSPPPRAPRPVTGPELGTARPRRRW